MPIFVGGRAWLCRRRWKERVRCWVVMRLPVSQQCSTAVERCRAQQEGGMEGNLKDQVFLEKGPGLFWMTSLGCPEVCSA